MNQATIFEYRPHRTRSTSIKAYHELKDLSTKQAAVYDVIKRHGPLCDSQIVEILGSKINATVPRRNELVKAGVVVEAYRDKGPTGIRVIFWKIAPGEEEILNEGEIDEI